MKTVTFSVSAKFQILILLQDIIKYILSVLIYHRFISIIIVPGRDRTYIQLAQCHTRIVYDQFNSFCVGQIGVTLADQVCHRIRNSNPILFGCGKVFIEVALFPVLIHTAVYVQAKTAGQTGVQKHFNVHVHIVFKILGNIGYHQTILLWLLPQTQRRRIHIVRLIGIAFHAQRIVRLFLTAIRKNVSDLPIRHRGIVRGGITDIRCVWYIRCVRLTST